MNNAKMWLVVKPTVGVPLFLAGVAIGSFAVHVAVLSNTSWVSDFLKGQEMGSGEQTAMAIDDPNAVKPASYQATADGDRLVITLPDGRQAVAVIERSDDLTEVSGLRPQIRD
jgi:light-harvesting protein B-800-850 alpha chain